jgi:hypothetical protein
MIMVSGAKYITSRGDSGAVSSAKNTLIYALIGLVIVFFSQTLVKFTVVIASLLVVGLTPVAVAGSAGAAADIRQNLKCGSNLNTGDTGNCDIKEGTNTVNDIVTKAINICSGQGYRLV